MPIETLRDSFKAHLVAKRLAKLKKTRPATKMGALKVAPLVMHITLIALLLLMSILWRPMVLRYLVDLGRFIFTSWAKYNG